MALKGITVSEQRLLIVNLIERMDRPVATVAREFGLSRKTIYKWLARWRAAPDEPLVDRSRRPHGSPARTTPALESQLLATRDAHGWGARKLRAVLKNQGRDVPAISTVHQVLVRHDRLQPRIKEPQAAAPGRFERAAANELWQLDHKGPLEIGSAKRYPLTILDDHSRYLLSVEPCVDLTNATTWNVLWDVFGQAGLPDALLCDNAFSARRRGSLETVSRFDSWLIRLNIKPLHGRPYHPQTQGKVERMHASYESEMYRHVRRDDDQTFRADALKWRQIYNTLRPHEALDDKPPITRWRPSLRKRPETLPPVEYATGSLLRKADAKGTLTYEGNRIDVGEGLGGEHVRLEPGDHDLKIYYAWKLIRTIDNQKLAGNRRLRI